MNSTTHLTQSVISRRAADIVAFVNREGWTIAAAVAYVRNSSTLGPESWASVITLAANELPNWARCPKCERPSPTGIPFVSVCAQCAQHS